MIVREHSDLAACEALADCWNDLADGCVFRGWTWLSTWWRHYGQARTKCGAVSADIRRRLSVIVAHEGLPGAERLAAVLPCYVESSLLRGNVLRLLGDGEVCSDHLGLIADRRGYAAAAESIAEHLAQRGDWDAIHFESVDLQDAASRELFATLSRRGLRTGAESKARCWSIDLPRRWEDFLAMQSKSHRKQLRRAERRLRDASDVRWRLVTNADEFEGAWETLADLHQRRRRSLGEQGCFASAAWAGFHREVAGRLFAEGRLRLSTLQLRNAPIAAEYHFAGDGATYAYQGGLDPENLPEQPGRLALIRCLQHAIAEGHSSFDLLRGDEAYKSHWRARPTETVDLLACRPKSLARLRGQAQSGFRYVRNRARRWTCMTQRPKPTSPTDAKSQSNANSS